MRPLRFLFVLVLITFFSLIYVWQQTEIFSFAYEAQKQLTVLNDLVDKNAILKYNIQRNASLIYINEKLPQGADFQMPDSYRLVKLQGPGNRSLADGGQALDKGNFLARFFSIKRQATAATINR